MASWTMTPEVFQAWMNKHPSTQHFFGQMFSDYRRSQAGQMDLGLITPSQLSVIMELQQTKKKRRGYSGTLLTGLGLEEEEARRKTLLGG